MPIRVMDASGNVAFEVETLAEALALRNAINQPPDEPKAKPTPLKPVAAAEPKPRPSPITGDVAVSKASYRILKGIEQMRLENTSWFTGKLAHWIGLGDAKELPPLMMQFRKDIDRLGVPFDEVITRQIIYAKGKKISVYSPGPRSAEALSMAREAALDGGLFVAAG